MRLLSFQLSHRHADFSTMNPSVIDASTHEVRAYISNHIGFLELNRPQALNALSLAMIRALQAALNEWCDDPDVLAIVVYSAQPRAFCAGGDVRFFYDAWQRGEPEAVAQFFIEEYSLNHTIFSYPKPYIALMQGVVMGGGMGISLAARHTGGLRIVTDSTKMAMPETRIGLFPDVGASWFLARIPTALGHYLAVTGTTIDAASALYAGLADAYLPNTALASLLDTLQSQPHTHSADVIACIAEETARHQQAIPTAPKACALATARPWIDLHFTKPDIPAIMASLNHVADSPAHHAWAEATRDLMQQRLSPLSMAVSLEVVTRAHHATMAECLRHDLDLTHSTFACGDVIEGVRALIVDKDHRPAWRFNTIENVTHEQVSQMFASPWQPTDHPLRHLQD